MKEDTKVNLVAMLGQEKADHIFKQTEESARLKKESQEKEKAELDRMVGAMIDKSYLIDGQYYSGHRWRGSHVAMWDAQKGEFLSIKYKFGMFSIQSVKHFSDVADTNEDGFIPFDKIEKRKI